MARDWRTIALAVMTAAAVASVCASGSPVEAQQAKTAKGQAKAPQAEAKSDEGEDGDTKAPAKKKRQDPAEAQRAVDAASKLLQAGKAEQASQSLTVTLAGGNLPPAIMARALYLRGIAYRQQSKPAQAIADLTSALWLKGGLGTDDRADALKQRAGAYADAGLTETGAVAAAAAPSSEGKEPRERAAGKSWGAVTTAQESTPDSGPPAQASGNWFKNWFNAWSPPAAQANTSAPAPASAPTTTTASIDKADPPPRPPQAASAARVSTAWSSKTEVHAAASPPTPPPRAAAKADGKYRVQLATVRTQREAEALAAKAKRALGALAAGGPEIDQAVLGNMGSFYRVRVGPFTSVQETQAICAKVKDAGFDCLTVTQ
jgi:cell division protein FtsN